MGLETALFSAVGALASAIVYLYTVIRSHHADTLKRLDECEADKEELWDRLWRVEEKVNGKGKAEN